jgi:hypothetical protein
MPSPSLFAGAGKVPGKGKEGGGSTVLSGEREEKGNSKADQYLFLSCGAKREQKRGGKEKAPAASIFGE